MSVNNGYIHDDSKNGWNPNDANGINAFSVSQPNLENGVPKDDVNDGVHGLEQAKRDREPLRFVKCLTNRPGLYFGKLDLRLTCAWQYFGTLILELFF